MLHFVLRRLFRVFSFFEGFGGAAGALGSVVSSFIGAGAQDRANAANLEDASRNRSFQERMSNTAWQRGTADMKLAGINPMLAFSQGGASSPSGSTGSSSGFTPDNPVDDYFSGLLSEQQLEIGKSTAEIGKSNADKAKSEATIAKNQAAVSSATTPYNVENAGLDAVISRGGATAGTAAHISKIWSNFMSKLKSRADRMKTLKDSGSQFKELKKLPEGVPMPEWFKVKMKNKGFIP